MDRIRRTPFKNRIGLFDFYRGVMMMAVILVHIMNCLASTPGAVDISGIILKLPVVVVSFFILSGYGFRPSEPSACLKKQAKQMLLPYVLMMAATVGLVMLKNIAKGLSPIDDVMAYIGGFLLVPTGDRSLLPWPIYETSTGWFLVALFWSWNILNLIFQMKDEKKRALAVVGAGALGMLLIGRIPQILCITSALNGVVLLYIGYLIRDRKFFYNKMPVAAMIFLLLLWAVTFLFGEGQMAAGIWKLGWLDFLGAAAGSVLLLKGYTYLIMPDLRLVEGISRVGRFTYWIMCFHGIDMIAVKMENVVSRLGLPYIATLVICLLWDACFCMLGCKVLKIISGVQLKKQKGGSLRHG